MATQHEVEHPKKAFGWAARDPSGFLSPFNFSRRETGDKDVAFKVLYCGVCHSDLHMLKNEWGISAYPLVPGHEVVGVVPDVGSKVEKFKVGDKVGVGCMVDSCRSCQSCADDLENHCPRYTLTYGAKYKDGTITYGGYSDSMVAEEHFIVRIPDGLPLDAAAPLLCAGITVYSPLRYFGLDKPNLNVGVIGLGGLGHMAVKFAKAFGANVTVISVGEFAASRTLRVPAIDHHEHNFTGNKTKKGTNRKPEACVNTVLRIYRRNCTNPPGFNRFFSMIDISRLSELENLQSINWNMQMYISGKRREEKENIETCDTL